MQLFVDLYRPINMLLVCRAPPQQRKLLERRMWVSISQKALWPTEMEDGGVEPSPAGPAICSPCAWSSQGRDRRFCKRASRWPAELGLIMQRESASMMRSRWVVGSCRRMRQRYFGIDMGIEIAIEFYSESAR